MIILGKGLLLLYPRICLLRRSDYAINGLQCRFCPSDLQEISFDVLPHLSGCAIRSKTAQSVIKSRRRTLTFVVNRVHTAAYLSITTLGFC